MVTNMLENGFEKLIVDYLVDSNHYELGKNADYNKHYAIDEKRLFRFLKATQAAKLAELHIEESKVEKKKFLDRLAKKLLEKGVLGVIRKGLKYKNHTLDLYMVQPSEGNAEAKKAYESNIFSVTRQLNYSDDYNKLALDICLFLNGLPIITLELKNQCTKQNFHDAIKQYRKDRSPDDLIFKFKRCLVHFAVDDNEVHMCTELKGETSEFLPFNKGNNGGAGNPPNPHGIKTDYLWRYIFSKKILSDIIENYAQIIEQEDEATGAKSYKQIFPRYHQLGVVSSLLADARQDGVGQRYLIQHSAGSGKSNSIAWLAHQLVKEKGNDGRDIFDTIIVVTDRVNLDKQIRETIKQFMQVSNTVGCAKDGAELADLIDGGKKIVITIVHKFQFALDKIEQDYRSKKFAIIIDEAHSSQNGSLAAKMNIAVSGNMFDDEDDFEDKLNKIMEGRRLAGNASYFAFTATPKRETIEMFGRKMRDSRGNSVLNEDGTHKFEPHYVYTMKQAIEEGFILDVLRYYTTYTSFYNIAKTVEHDPLFDVNKAQKILRCYVESQRVAIEEKSEVIVEHFHAEVAQKIKGEARAMVVTSSIQRAIEFFMTISRLLKERHSPYKAVVAFSGEAEYGGETYTEAKLNDFPSSQIEDRFRQGEYRILVVANKFQTGYDEPLLHTMYVDKKLKDVKAVQTLSRLNRCHADKNDVFVLDFQNSAADIEEAFSTYYKTTILANETYANNLNDIVDVLESFEIYQNEDVDLVVCQYLAGEPREKGIDPTLDACAEKYKGLVRDDQIEFRTLARRFVRSYNYVSSILPYGSQEWEKLSIFLAFLLSKLPKSQDEDDTGKIVEDVELQYYRLALRETASIKVKDANGVVYAASPSADVAVPVEEKAKLSEIVKAFNEMWGDGRIYEVSLEILRKQVERVIEAIRQDEKCQNAMRNSDENNARDEIKRLVDDSVRDSAAQDFTLHRAYHDENMLNKNNQTFHDWLLNLAFEMTYTPSFGEL